MVLIPWFTGINTCQLLVKLFYKIKFDINIHDI